MSAACSRPWTPTTFSAVLILAVMIPAVLILAVMILAVMILTVMVLAVMIQYRYAQGECMYREGASDGRLPSNDLLFVHLKGSFSFCLSIFPKTALLPSASSLGDVEFSAWRFTDL